MYLFFDTETTGLPKNWKAAVTNLDNWPRLVQIAWVYYDDKGNLIHENDFLIKPDGFTIPKEASDIHKITTKHAEEDGFPIKVVLTEFQGLISQCSYLVAHNMSFDEMIVGAEFLRLKMINALTARKRICTMERSTNFCAIPGSYDYKWPKLSELHKKLFGVGFEESHNAANDIKATARCFWEMKKRKIITE